MYDPATNFTAAIARQLEARRDALRNQPEITAPTNFGQTLLNWWRSMPPATRNHPWSLETIIAVAFHSHERRPSAWRVGQALRRMGWKTKRDWTNAGRNRRLWTPPENDFDL